jgi:type 2 lantibiotic biosynthesis protein LanM
MPFTTHEHFSRRLAADGISEDDLLYILGEQEEALRQRQEMNPPPWVVALEAAFSQETEADELPLTAERTASHAHSFLVMLRPLILAGRRRLHEGVQALRARHGELPFDPQVVDGFMLPALSGRLSMKLTRVMLLELNVARLMGRLSGETTTDRFASFIRLLGDRDFALGLLEEYPVLARLAVENVDRWVAFQLDFLTHLCADKDEIARIFCEGTDPGKLVRVDCNLGDPHRGGRTVQVGAWSSGLRLAYKPRALALDAHFNELLAWLNERVDLPPFRALRILDRGAYGWSEFVAAEPCHSADAAERFYRRQGAYAALLRVLAGADFHYENVIAAGEHPTLVDLEGLFRPRISNDAPTSPADRIVASTLDRSVLRIGLFPSLMPNNPDEERVDFSGLGSPVGQLTPFTVHGVENAGTDQARAVRTRARLEGAHNQPRLGEKPVDHSDYIETLCHGFRSMYRFLLQHRDALLAPEGPMASFGRDEVRVIARASRLYGCMLQECTHPDALQSGLVLDRFLDHLWITAERWPEISEFIPAERAAMHMGDIPIFNTHPSSLDIWDGMGAPIIGVIQETGQDVSVSLLRELSGSDLDRQEWFIRASFASQMSEDHDGAPASDSTTPTSTLTRERLVKAAGLTADWLSAAALRHDGEVAWIGLTQLRDKNWVINTRAEIDLYSGIAGICLFLAYHERMTGESATGKLAREAAFTLRRLVELRKQETRSIGGFCGWGAILYTFAHLGALWTEEAFWNDAEALVTHVEAHVENDDALDIISGAAGCIGGLLTLHHCTGSRRVLDVAKRCGEWLIARSEPQARGRAWKTSGCPDVPLTGFSHGAAGMAWALLELASVSGEERFFTPAREAIEYERSLFSNTARNWPDLRPWTQSTSAATKSFMVAWCHGAPGIGLARLRALRHWQDPALHEEIAAAVETTTVRKLGNQSLCHGELGNIDFLLGAREVKSDLVTERIARTTSAILDSIEEGDRRCATPLRVDTPGLMLGVAGIGYGLLRLADPELVPSILSLEPPRLKFTAPPL